MSRKSKFLIGLATAIITFGALFATLGQDCFNKCGNRYHHRDNCCMDEMHQRHCDEGRRYKHCNYNVENCPKQEAKTDSVK